MDTEPRAMSLIEARVPSLADCSAGLGHCTRARLPLAICLRLELDEDESQRASDRLSGTAKAGVAEVVMTHRPNRHFQRAVATSCPPTEMRPRCLAGAEDVLHTKTGASKVVADGPPNVHARRCCCQSSCYCCRWRYHLH